MAVRPPTRPRLPATRRPDAPSAADVQRLPAPVPRAGSVAEGVAPDQLGYLFDDATPPIPAVASDAPHELGTALANARLAGAGDGSVRAMLARKVCRLLPDLPPDGRDKATAVALRTLEQLAQDHVVRVRAALASAIKDIACAPPSVVNTLARDVERTVAEPVLHCCATLTDADLLAIIAARGESWALSAIARRRTVSGPVSAAIAGAGCPEATGVLLDNAGAVIEEPTLDRLVADAAEHRAFQEKLARRAALPRRLAVRLATFVDRSVLEVLKSRPDFDDATAAEIVAAVRRRVDWVESQDPRETPERRAIRLHRRGLLDETAIGDALSWEEVEFVRTALALRAAVAPATVDEILASRSARAVTALVWRAGLTMRAAMQIQARAADIPPRAMLNARQGTDFPLSTAEMARTLAIYGIAA